VDEIIFRLDTISRGDEFIVSAPDMLRAPVAELPDSDVLAPAPCRDRAPLAEPLGAAPEGVSVVVEPGADIAPPMDPVEPVGDVKCDQSSRETVPVSST